MKLKSQTGKIIELKKVLVAGNIANNLISLRKFAEMGLKIFLDDKEIKIYDPQSGEAIITGKYNKPNWNISFTTESENSELLRCRCTAQLVSLDEFIEQSQTDIQDISVSEGAREQDAQEDTSAIGRENVNELDQGLNPEEDMFIDSDIDQDKLNRQIHDITQTQNENSETNFSEKIDHPEKTLEKTTEGMRWHRRLGHISLDYLRRLKKNMKELKEVKFEDEIRDCEICILAKMERLPFKETRDRATRQLERIHTDIMGPIRPSSYPGSNRYIITFTDDFSRYAKIYSLSHKSQAGDCLEKFLGHSRNLLDRDEKVCFIRADCGRENLGGKFREVMEEEKIDPDFSPPHTPEINGLAERINKTIEFRVRSLLLDSGLPASMWILAAEAAMHIYNRTPHKSIEFQTPLSKFAPGLKLHID